MIFQDKPSGQYRYFVGIQPGMHGAIAVVDAKGALLLCQPMPGQTISVAAGRNAQRQEVQPHVSQIVDNLLANYPPDRTLVLCEEPAKANVRGMTNTMQFRFHAGMVAGALTVRGYSLIRTYPAEWKGAMNLIGFQRRDSLMAAKQIWPRKKLDEYNRAEAALLAEWLRRLCASGRFPGVKVIR